MTDQELQKVKLYAHNYASKNGDKSPEANYVNRYNGYFQGYMDSNSHVVTEVAQIKYAQKESIWPLTKPSTTSDLDDLI